VSKYTQTKLQRIYYGKGKTIFPQLRLIHEVYNSKESVMTYVSEGQVINLNKFLKRHASKLKRQTKIRNEG
jgi:hypothetical protein